MASVFARTSSVSGTVTTPASVAAGDILDCAVWTDGTGVAITAPDGTWTQVEQLQDSGPANRLAVFRKTLSAAPAASYTFGGPTIGGITMTVIRPGAGETLSTVTSSAVASIVGGSGVLASTAIDTTPTPNVVVGTWCADDASTVSSAPSTLANGTVPAVTSGGLATYDATDVSNAAFSDSLTWSTPGTERIAIVRAYKFTVAGPTIDVQPANQVAVLAGPLADVDVTALVEYTLSGAYVGSSAEVDDGGGMDPLTISSPYSMSDNGVDAVSLRINPVTALLNGYQYQVTVEDANGSVVSNPFTLTVYAGDTLVQPSGSTNVSGQLASPGSLTSDYANGGRRLRVNCVVDGVVIGTRTVWVQA